MNNNWNLHLLTITIVSTKVMALPYRYRYLKVKISHTGKHTGKDTSCLDEQAVGTLAWSQ